MKTRDQLFDSSDANLLPTDIDDALTRINEVIGGE